MVDLFFASIRLRSTRALNRLLYIYQKEKQVGMVEEDGEVEEEERKMKKKKLTKHKKNIK